jgi:hypothetical protein
MLSKCANPDCSEKFLFLHTGKLFYLAPTPAAELNACALSQMRERFWLCDKCAKMMTIVWDGNRAQLIPLPKNPVKDPKSEGMTAPLLRRRAAHAGIENT